MDKLGWESNCLSYICFLYCVSTIQGVLLTNTHKQKLQSGFGFPMLIELFFYSKIVRLYNKTKDLF